MTTTVLFLCKDVFFWPIVKESASNAGVHLIIVRSMDDPKWSQVEAEAVACCLIDLSSVQASDIASTVAELKQKVGAQARMVAFGPHVQESRLSQAQQAGCSPVLSRGQFQAKLPEYLAQWLA